MAKKRKRGGCLSTEVVLPKEQTPPDLVPKPPTKKKKRKPKAKRKDLKKEQKGEREDYPE